MQSGHQVDLICMHHPLVSSQLYNLDFSGLDGKQQNTTVMSYEERFPVSMRKLRTSAVTIPKIDELIQKRIDKSLSRHFIQYEVTTTTDAKMFLQRFEEWMVIMLVAKVHRSKREEEARNLHVRLLKDPVGSLTTKIALPRYPCVSSKRAKMRNC